jgi:predicted DNA-binding transcriptional regulator YafY
VWLRYRSGESGEEETERELDPYAVVCWARSWYVVGYCHLRRGMRMFRLDRVRGVELRDERFEPPAGFDGLGFALRSLATLPGRWEVEVDLARPVEEIRRWMPPTLGVIEAAANGGTTLRGRSDDLDRLARELLAFRCRFVVRRPAELRAELRRLAAEIGEMAEADRLFASGR